MFTLRNRIAVGTAIFVALALIDLYRNGRSARRWREYLFLLTATGLAMMYGAVNDQVTSAISWEYFYYGKELWPVLGPQTPPDRVALRWQAAKIGVQATWTVGLLLGAALLMANNPRRGRPPLPFPALSRFLILVLLLTVSASIVGGLLGWSGKLNWCSSDFRELAAINLWRPKHFMASWGTHLGAYIGGIIGGAIAVVLVVKRKIIEPRMNADERR